MSTFSSEASELSWRNQAPFPLNIDSSQRGFPKHKDILLYNQSTVIQIRKFNIDKIV